MGTWLLTDDQKVITEAVDFVLNPFIIICIIGAITFTIAFLGCVGAAREHVLLLKSVSYDVCLLWILKIIINAALLITQEALNLFLFICYFTPVRKSKVKGHRVNNISNI